MHDCLHFLFSSWSITLTFVLHFDIFIRNRLFAPQKQAWVKLITFQIAWSGDRFYLSNKNYVEIVTKLDPLNNTKDVSIRGPPKPLSFLKKIGHPRTLFKFILCLFISRYQFNIN